MEDLEFQINEENVHTWICSIQPQLKKNNLILFVPNPHMLEWIETHALEKIRNFFQEKSENSWRVFIKVGAIHEGKTNSVRAKAKPKPHLVFLPKKRNFDPKFRFDNFVEGKSNQMALAMAKSVASTNGSANNPLFLYGGAGLGKTHLLNAIGNRMMELNEKAKFVYIQAENFVSGMVHAIKNGLIAEFKNYYRSLDAILVDDIQLFVKKTQTQEEFFHTFNSLFEKRNQIVLTCDRYPKKLTGVEERLRSRFSCGLIQEIYPPEIETRVAILERKSEERCFSLPRDVAFFIAANARSNVRELEGCLTKVIAFGGFMETGGITVDVARNALQDLLAANEVINSVKNIQSTVADYYQIRVSDLVSPKRNRAVVRARQIAISLSKEITNWSLSRIGDSFGGRDHATVLHSLRKIKELQQSDPRFHEEYKTLRNMFGN